MPIKQNTSHDIVVESLTEALLKLAETKPLSDIKIAELCKKAGVSRISFYRNFDSVNDILVKHLNSCLNDWWEVFLKENYNCISEKFWTEIMKIYRKNQKLIYIIYANNLSFLLKEHLFSCCGPRQEFDVNDAFVHAAFAGAIYGIIDEWIKRGMKDIPESFKMSQINDFIKAVNLSVVNY